MWDGTLFCGNFKVHCPLIVKEGQYIHNKLTSDLSNVPVYTSVNVTAAAGSLHNPFLQRLHYAMYSSLDCTIAA